MCYRYDCFQVSHPVTPSGMLSLDPLLLRVRLPPKFQQLVLMLISLMVRMVDTEKNCLQTPSASHCCVSQEVGSIFICLDDVLGEMLQ